MRTFLDCVPCFVRQTLDAARMVTDDSAVQERILRRVLRMAGDMNLLDSPPAMGQKIHRLIREIGENPDPYLEVKERCNQFAMELSPWVQARIQEAEDPFEVAVRCAVAGNILDFGVHASLDEEEARKTVYEVLHVPIDMDALRRMKLEVDEAQRILYIGDNAGEILFDRFLIEQFSPGKTVYAVRSFPVINDATRVDAEAVGLTEVARVIDNGSDAPGTILDDCSEEFIEVFETADVVIAKGQGNYETLSEVDRPIWFLLKAKCPVIARDIGCSVGAVLVLARDFKETRKSEMVAG